MPLRRGENCRLQLPLRRPSLRAMRKFRSLAALVAIATLIPLSSAGAMPPPLADVEGKDAASLAAAMTAGETSSEEIVAAYLQRIRSEERTSEIQSLMRISYAVFCLKNKKYIDILHTYQLS